MIKIIFWKYYKGDKIKKLNILITAIGGDIGGNILNILSQQKCNIELFIVGTDINKDVFALDKVDKFYQVVSADNEEYEKEILKIVIDNAIDLIIPISEKEIQWFNNNKNLLNPFHIKILINNKNIIDKFLDKLDTSHSLQKISIKAPQTYLFSNYINQLDFPMIIKGRFSITTKNIYIVNNQNQLDYLKISLNNHSDYIIQQYIGSMNEEYTTCVYNDKNRFEVISFKRRLIGGMTSFATISNEKKLNDYAQKIAHSFDLQGSINIQSRKIENNFYIFEINPRFSSTVYIRNYFGFQDVIWWINTIFNDNIIDLKPKEISLCGTAILGYQYKFL